MHWAGTRILDFQRNTGLEGAHHSNVRWAGSRRRARRAVRGPRTARRSLSGAMVAGTAERVGGRRGREAARPRPGPKGPPRRSQRTPEGTAPTQCEAYATGATFDRLRRGACNGKAPPLRGPSGSPRRGAAAIHWRRGERAPARPPRNTAPAIHSDASTTASLGNTASRSRTRARNTHRDAHAPAERGRKHQPRRSTASTRVRTTRERDQRAAAGRAHRPEPAQWRSSSTTFAPAVPAPAPRCASTPRNVRSLSNVRKPTA